MSNTITLKQLENNLKTWRKQRQIDEKSTAEAQYNWYLKEREELKDAIGDMAVCLINARALAERQTLLPNVRHKIIINNCNNDLINLKAVCYKADIDIEECLAMAWAEIEHRVGLTREDGFHKWKDLTHAERLQVAESGQLDNAPNHVIDQCFKLCTEDEQTELNGIVSYF